MIKGYLTRRKEWILDLQPMISTTSMTRVYSQHYQYPPPYFQPRTPINGPFTPNHVAPSQEELLISAVADKKSLPVETTNASSNGVANGGTVKRNNGSAAVKPPYPSSFNSNSLWKGSSARWYSFLYISGSMIRVKYI